MRTVHAPVRVRARRHTCLGGHSRAAGAAVRSTVSAAACVVVTLDRTRPPTAVHTCVHASYFAARTVDCGQRRDWSRKNAPPLLPPLPPPSIFPLFFSMHARTRPKIIYPLDQLLAEIARDSFQSFLDLWSFGISRLVERSAWKMSQTPRSKRSMSGVRMFFSLSRVLCYKQAFVRTRRLKEKEFL